MGYIVTIRDIEDIATEQSRHDWAAVTGRQNYLKPNIYIDNRSGWRFCKIIGAVAYPYIDAGCVMVAGIQSEPMGRVVILEYSEHRDIYEMIELMSEHRQKYDNHSNNIDIVGEWIGDTEKYLDIIAKVSHIMESKYGAFSGLYVRQPAGWNDNKPFQTWARHLHRAIAEKRIVLQGQIELLNRLQSFGNECLDTAKIETHPSVGILAALVYTIGIERQWESDRNIANNTAINIDI